jgi:hypothetical protein
MWYVVKQQPVHSEKRVYLLGAKFLNVFLPTSQSLIDCLPVDALRDDNPVNPIEVPGGLPHFFEANIMKLP